MSGRVYASDLPQDARWPYFVEPQGLQALIGMIYGHDFDSIVAAAALTKPAQRRTNAAKRLYWVQPDDTIMIRLTNGERHALQAAAADVAREAICASAEIQGVGLHLRKRAAAFRRAVRVGLSEPTR